MKKLMLVISFFSIILMNNFSSIDVVEAEGIETKEENCFFSNSSIVRIINNYNVFKGNGFVYSQDERYNYIVTSSNILSRSSNYKVIYEDGNIVEAILIGSETQNQVALFRTKKNKNSQKVCKGNSNYISKGQLNYVYGYYDNNNSFSLQTYLSNVGVLYSNNNYKRIYKSLIQIQSNDYLMGSGVFDELGRLVGVITNLSEKMLDGTYMIDSNKLYKIADNIIKTGNYKVNYIKYELEDYSLLGNIAKNKYGVNQNVSKGVVVTNFSFLRYIFGGLNKGMVIVAVNGVEISNGYELDKQLIRYKKGSNICLKVIKNNGKEAFYHVKV